MAMRWNRPSRREPEHGVLDVPSGDNVRDLGGYPVGGTSTKTHRFLRSGFTSSLSEDDIAYLRGYGVSRVVDLRSVAECQSGPDRLAKERGVLYLNQPLYDHNLRDDVLEHDAQDLSWMAAGYLRMLANKTAVRNIFSFMAPATRDECILFHCAAGMDRTGVLAAVILGLCGVDRNHIVADYCYSFVRPEVADAVIFDGAPVGDTDLKPLMEAIGGAFDYTVRRYGGIYSYLRSCGISAWDLYCVRRHLLA